MGRISFVFRLVALVAASLPIGSWSYEALTEQQSYQLERAKAQVLDDRLFAMAEAGNCYAYLKIAGGGPRGWKWQVLMSAYECGVKNFTNLKPFVRGYPLDHPLFYEGQATNLGYVPEARTLLERALEAGSISAGMELAEWEIDGVLAPPNAKRANGYLTNAALISQGPPTEWNMDLEPVNRDWQIGQILFLILKMGVELENAEFWLNYVNKDPEWIDDTKMMRELIYRSKPSLNPKAMPNLLIVVGGLLLLLFFAGYVFKRRTKTVASAGRDAQSSSHKESVGVADEIIASVLKEPSKESELVTRAFGDSKTSFSLGSNILGLLCLLLLLSVVLNAFLPSMPINTGALALLMGVMQTISGGLLGYIIKLMLDLIEGDSPAAIGRTWSGWVILVSGMSESSFFGTFDPNDLARLAIAIIGWGGVAFCAGWVVGKFRQNN